MRIRQMFIGGLFLLALADLCAEPAHAQSHVAGTYRCVSFNVGGRGGRCTSPPLMLQANGEYDMSSEHGTYTVEGNQIVLSESKIRGAGHLQDNEIVFEYSYKGLQQTVTYRREAQATPNSLRVPRTTNVVAVSITITFPPTNGSVGWINTANLIPEGGRKEDGYETLAVSDGKHLVKVDFKAVATGRIYTLLVGSGFETRELGKVDLTAATAPVKLSVQAPGDHGSNSQRTN